MIFAYGKSNQEPFEEGGSDRPQKKENKEVRVRVCAQKIVKSNPKALYLY